MTMRTTCPNCEKALRIKPELTGKKIRCPQCQHVFAVAMNGPPALGAGEFSPMDGHAQEPTAAQSGEAGSNIAPRNAATDRGATRTTAMVLLFFFGAAALFYETFFVLMWHWFWATSFALLISSWIVWGVIALLWERDFAARRVARWVNSDIPLDKIMTDLAGLDGDIAALGLGMSIALSIASFYLIPWAPTSAWGYIGFGSVCLLGPLVVLGCYIAAFEKAFGKRDERVFTLLHAGQDAKYPQILEAWETRKRDAEATRQQAKVAQKTQRAVASGPEALGKMLSTMNAEEMAAFAKNLNESNIPELPRYRRIMEPVIGQERMDVIEAHASPDFWKSLSSSSDDQIRRISEAFKVPAIDKLREIVSQVREQKAELGTSEKLSQAAVWGRFGYYVARILMGG